MNFPDVNHELSDERPDVMSMDHMGAPCEDVGTTQFLNHLARDTAKAEP